MITRLYVHNFRCLVNFELKLSENSSTLLIGRNGAGKSTVGVVLEKLAGIMRGPNRVGSIFRPEDFAFAQSTSPMRFGIEVLIDGVLYAYSLALDLPEKFKELRVFEESLSAAGQPVYTRHAAQVTLVKTGSDSEANFLVDWHLVALPIIQEKSTSDPLYVFKTWLSRMLILAPIPALMSGQSQVDMLAPTKDCGDFAGWFSRLLADVPAAYTQIDAYLKLVMPDFLDVKNAITGAAARSLTVQFKSGNATLSVPFADLSDGEKCFFLCAVVMAAMKAHGQVFCFWDEPDNYLAMSEVGHFVMELRRAVQQGSQLLVTSHNPEAVRQFSAENTLVLGRRNHLEPAIVRPLNECTVVGDLVDALIRNDVDPWQ